MDSTSEEKTIERSGPVLRDEYDGIKFRTLTPGITTHPLFRGGRPCIEGTGLRVTDIVKLKNYQHMGPAEIADHYAIKLFMVEYALNYYAAHTDYIDTEIELSILNHDQMVEAQYDKLPAKLLSRRKSVT